MNNKMLQKLVETTSLEYFKQPFKHKAYFNSRLRTTGGRYVLSTHHIEINPKQFSRFGKEALINIISMNYVIIIYIYPEKVINIRIMTLKC